MEINSVWDLVNTRRRYPEAIPALLRLLPEVEDRRLKEGIVRALSVKEARGSAVKPLIDAMRSSVGDEMLAWAVGNALAVTVIPGEDVFDDLAALLRDQRLGIGRQMLADALVRTGDPRALAVLLEVLPREGITGHVIHALGNLGSVEAISALEGYLGSKNAFIRREAKQALKKITGAGSSSSNPDQRTPD